MTSTSRRFPARMATAPEAEQQLEDMEALFVQTAASMTSDRGTITLHGLSPSTLYFADRPQREVGHMMSSHFVANWACDEDWYRILSHLVRSNRSPVRGAQLMVGRT